MINPYKLKKVSTILRYGIELESIRTFKKLDNKYIGKWVKDKVVTLGPTFIKIGQLMSTRKDIFGKEFTDELKALQDNVLPISLDDLLADISPLMISKFKTIDVIPIASASIGQVHKAQLVSGENVVIKVRRPGISTTIKDDFELVMFLLQNIGKLIKSRRLEEINILFKEYYSILVDEIDFVKEKNNMLVFSKIFKNVPWIKVPGVFESASCQGLITMEYVPSFKIDNTDAIDQLKFNKQKIADKLIETYISQIIDHGIINLDPHPGNIGISESGKLVFYDFGMILMLDEKFRDSFDSLLFTIYNKDIPLISKITVNNGFVVLENGDDAPFRKFLAVFLDYIETLDVDKFKIEYLDSFDTRELNFILASKFVMLLRGITILEGVCKDLDPSFKYSRNLDKYMGKFIFNIQNIERKADKDINTLFNNNSSSYDDTSLNSVKMQLEGLRTKIDLIEKSDNNKFGNISSIVIAFLVLLNIVKSI